MDIQQVESEGPRNGGMAKDDNREDLGPFKDPQAIVCKVEEEEEVTLSNG